MKLKLLKLAASHSLSYFSPHVCCRRLPANLQVLVTSTRLDAPDVGFILNEILYIYIFYNQQIDVSTIGELCPRLETLRISTIRNFKPVFNPCKV